MSQLSDANITELRSLDAIPNAPDRNKPIGFLLRLARKKIGHPSLNHWLI